MPNQIVFSILIFLGSSLGIYQYLKTGQWYGYQLSDTMPQWAYVVQYYFSWGIRIFGMVVGLGILFKKELFRKLGLGFATFSILTLYWKHSPSYFFGFAKDLENQYQRMMPGFELDLSIFVKDTLIALYIFEIAFWALFIFYFTRPSIKKHFG